MEYDFKATMYSWIEGEGIKSHLFLHPEQQEGFEFTYSFQDIIDQLVEWHQIPSTKKLDEKGLDELKIVRQTLQKYADATQELIDFYTKEK
jgi:hypothetical protein